MMFNKIYKYIVNPCENTEVDDIIEEHQEKIKKREKEETERILKIKNIEKDLDDNINRIDSTLNSLKTRTG